MKKNLLISAAGIGFLSFPLPAAAHAFGQLYNLPVPFWLYLYGGATAIIVSFLVIGYFFNKTAENISYQSVDLSNFRIFQFLTSRFFVRLVKAFGIFLFIITVVSGFVGSDNPYLNFNMNFFWVIFLLGFTYLTAAIGNFYGVINPWKTLTGVVEKLYGSPADGMVRYPTWLGYFPTLVFYFILIWFELVGSITPAKLSLLFLQYTLLNAVGVILWGKSAWFKYGEFFSVFFSLVGKIAPVEYRQGKIFLRPLLAGLLKERAESFSLLLFVLFMLSSTAFDGFKETLVWVKILINNFDSIFWPIFGPAANTAFQTGGLILSPFLFLIIYIALIYIAKWVTKSSYSFREIALQFVFPLVPVAFVYNVAHYYSLLFTEGPNIVRLVSDPFGYGWNIFGTGGKYYSAILGANFIWHSQVALILLGHIAGVYLAHRVALRVFPGHRAALLSQVPMLVMMVVFTMIGLWVLSQPITASTV